MGQMLYYFTRLGPFSRGGGQPRTLVQQSGDLHYSLFGKGSSTYYYDTQVIMSLAEMFPMAGAICATTR